MCFSSQTREGADGKHSDRAVFSELVVCTVVCTAARLSRDQPLLENEVPGPFPEPLRVLST